MDQLKSFGGAALDAGRRLGGAGGSQTHLINVTKQVIDDREPKPLDKATLTSVVAAIQSQDAEIRLQGLLAGVVASEDDTNKLSLVSLGALPPVISATELQDQKASYAALRILWHLSKLEENRPIVVQNGGVEAATKAANSSHSANQYAALRVILHVCETRSFHKQLLKSQLPFTLTKLLGSQADQVSYVSASCISYLVETDCQHPAFIDDGFIGTLANVCREGQENNKYAGFNVVRSLAKNEDTIKKLASSGIVDSLVEAMSTPSERLQYISMSTLASIPAVATDKMSQMVNPVLRGLASQRSSVISAAARFIRTFASNETLKAAVIKKNDYVPFINALSSQDPIVQNAGALALNALLKTPEAAAAFVKQGGVASVGKLFAQSTNGGSTAIQIVWPLSFNPENHAALLEHCKEFVVKLAGGHDNVTTHFFGSVVASSLAIQETNDSVKAFLDAHDHKTTELAYEMTTEDTAAIREMFDRTHNQGQRMCAWVFALLSSRSPQLFVRSQGHDALDYFACSGTPEIAEFANRVLGEVDLTTGVTPEDASALLDFFLEDIQNEVKAVEKLKAKRDALENDLRVRYRKRENIDKLSLFKPLGFVSEDTNAKLKVAGEMRQQIDQMNEQLVSGIEEIDPLLPGLQRDLDVFNELFAKQEDQQKIKALKQQIADVSKQIAEISKKIEGEQELKNQYEGDKRNLVAKMSQKPQLEKERIGVVGELEDVQYQIDNYDKALSEMNGSLEELQKQKEELEKRLEELRQQAEDLMKAIQAAKDEIEDAEKRIVDYEDLKNTIFKFKKLRKDVKEKYGEELNELAEFHALLGGLMNSGYNKLKALSGEETPRDSSSAFTRENIHKFLDFGSKAEVELDERVSMLHGELEARRAKGKRALQDLEDQLKALNTKIEGVETELSRLVDKISVADMRKGQMPSKDQLNIKKQQLQDNVDKIDKEIGDLDKLQSEINTLNGKIEEQTKTLAHDNAHKRRLEAEVAELERQLKLLYGTLDTDLNKFAEAFTRFKKARTQIEAKLRPLMAQATQWKKLFAEEKRLTTDAWTSLFTVVTDIQVVVEGLTNAKDDDLFLNEDK